MGINLGKEKQILALIQNGNNLEAIKNEYWQIENYTINYESDIIQKQRYRYTAKQIMDKYKIPNISWLMFLLSQSAEKIGFCEFCENDIQIHSSRTSSNIRSCECVGKCSNCLKAYTSRVGNEGLCSSCYWDKKANEPKKPLTQEELEQKWYQEIEFPVFYAETSDLIGQDLDYLHFIAKVLKEKLNLFRKIIKFREE